MTVSLVQAEPSLTFPETLEALAPPPSLLPGESLKGYQILRHAILAELEPGSAIEWLLAIDIVELSWEIQRYRLLRHRLLEKSRQRAIADALNLIDVMGIAEDARDDARRYTELNAHAWRYDKEAAIEIEGRLASFGHDDTSLDSDVLMYARELYIVFEGLIISAQHRRTMLLREIEGRRHRAVRETLRKNIRLRDCDSGCCRRRSISCGWPLTIAAAVLADIWSITLLDRLLVALASRGCRSAGAYY